MLQPRVLRSQGKAEVLKETGGKEEQFPADRRASAQLLPRSLCVTSDQEFVPARHPPPLKRSGRESNPVRSTCPPLLSRKHNTPHASWQQREKRPIKVPDVIKKCGPAVVCSLSHIQTHTHTLPRPLKLCTCPWLPRCQLNTE